MAIYKLIANGAFGLLGIEAMSKPYEAALVDLGVTTRDDPITELIAKAIENVVAMTGERDPKEIEQRAINALRVRRTDAAQCKADPMPATPWPRIIASSRWPS
jgi:hypothetical protein